MRKDFNKLLCEHPRYGHSNCFGDSRHSKIKDGRDDSIDMEIHATEGSHGRESMLYRHHRVKGRGMKSLAENLNPLIRFLDKACGRKWDDVFSEIRQTFKPTNTINQHIYIHLWQYVNNKLYVRDGEIWETDPGYTSYEGPYRGYDNFFVDPRNGILRRTEDAFKSWKNRRRFKNKEPKPVTEIDVDNVTKLVKINDLWYEFKFRPGEVVNYGDPISRRFFVRDYDLVDGAQHCKRPQGYVAYSKRSLSHKELKKFGLLS